MAPRFLRSPSGSKLSRSKDFTAEPVPASISARYLKMKRKEDYLRGSVEKESRLSSQSPRATKIDQLFASASHQSGLNNVVTGAHSVQHSYSLQQNLKILSTIWNNFELKMPKSHKLGMSGLNSSSNPNLAQGNLTTTSRSGSSKLKGQLLKDQSGQLLFGNESASKSWKKPPNLDVLRRQPSGAISLKKNAKSSSVQSAGSGSNLKVAAQGATDAMSSQSKLKLSSLFLSNLHSPSQAKTARDRRNQASTTTTQLDSGAGGRMMRLTVTSGKNNAPLVQINNIVGEIKDTTQINRVASGGVQMPQQSIQDTVNTTHSQLLGSGAARQPRGSHASKTQGGSKAGTRRRSRSRKSPSLEGQTGETLHSFASPKAPKKQAGYDKQTIAQYLQKNRLVNL